MGSDLISGNCPRSKPDPNTIGLYTTGLAADPLVDEPMALSEVTSAALADPPGMGASPGVVAVSCMIKGDWSVAVPVKIGKGG